MQSKFKNLKRAIEEMPPDVEIALQSSDLMDAYRERPAYQQNDYLSWIKRAKQAKTLHFYDFLIL